MGTLQGPLDFTSGDFWHMIVQEQCTNIVMLCNIMESVSDSPLERAEGMEGLQNQKKCSEYFPTKETTEKIFECYTIKYTGERLVRATVTLLTLQYPSVRCLRRLQSS